MISGVKGMNDVWPEQVIYWQRLESVAATVLSRFGYEEIRTPILESIELFQRSVGESTDIVQKEMFTLTDRKGRVMALRPEGTAAVVRALIQQGRDGIAEVQKYYYFGPMFRYERPQKGRLRQFHQLGAELYGSTSLVGEAELIEAVWHYFDALGLQQISLQLNTLGDENCRPQYRQKLLQFLNSIKPKLCSDCQARIDTNPLRVLDCKNSQCQSLLQAAPKMVDSLCAGCQQHFTDLQKLLKASGRKFELNPNMVRGLDYYNRTVFEFAADSIGSQNAVCGGGRYDSLVASLGGKATPAIGFAMGLERLLLLLEQQQPITPSAPHCWIIYMGENLQSAALLLANELRQQGLSCGFDQISRSLKHQFGRANKMGAPFALVLGEQEIKDNSVAVKNLKNSTQVTMPRQELLPYLHQQLKGNL